MFNTIIVCRKCYSKFKTMADAKKHLCRRSNVAVMPTEGRYSFYEPTSWNTVEHSSPPWHTTEPAAPFSGSGGSFGGAGASGSWDDNDSSKRDSCQPSQDYSSSSDSSYGSSSSGSCSSSDSSSSSSSDW